MKSLINTRFGLAVRRERLARGMSQQALADALGMSQSFVYNIENVKRDIPLGTFGFICEYFGVPYEDMLR